MQPVSCSGTEHSDCCRAISELKSFVEGNGGDTSGVVEKHELYKLATEIGGLNSAVGRVIRTDLSVGQIAC